MPGFESLEISTLTGYPLPGLRLRGDDEDLARKTFELALNDDHLETF